MNDQSSQLKNVLGYILPVVILVIGYLGLLRFNGTEPVVREQIEKVAQELLVAPAVAHEKVLLLETDGVVVPYREIQLAAQVAGRIAQKSTICRAGHYVEEGQELFRIDDRDYKLEVSRINKQLVQSTLELEEVAVEIRNVGELAKISEMELELQLKDFNRLKKLEGDQVILASDLERAQRAVLTARTTKTQLSGQAAKLSKGKYRMEAARDLAQIQLDKATLDDSRTIVKSPVSGVIIRDLVEEDSYAQKGTPLVTIEDTSHVEVKCNLRMDDLYWIWDQRAGKPVAGTGSGEKSGEKSDEYRLPKTPVDVIYELVGRAGAIYKWNGHLERYDGLGLDQETRTVPVRVVVDKPHRPGATGDSGPSTLVRGMYVTVLIKANPMSPLVRVPERAIQPGDRVWVVKPGAAAGEGTLSLIEHVDLVRTSGEGASTEWIIDNSSGSLQPNQLVVVRPFTGAESGDAVRYKQSRVVKKPSLKVPESGEASK
jgi:multidrug efflux pump subunit AcrA (membrane-fusion protein)